MTNPTASEMLATLTRLSAGGGERDDGTLRRFAEIVGTLRGLPGATGLFRARVASASGWAALLFSSWRHLKYDKPDESGASRIRAFIERDLAVARAHPPTGAGAPTLPGPVQTVNLKESGTRPDRGAPRNQ